MMMVARRPAPAQSIHSYHQRPGRRFFDCFFARFLCCFFMRNSCNVFDCVPPFLSAFLRDWALRLSCSWRFDDTPRGSGPRATSASGRCCRRRARRGRRGGASFLWRSSHASFLAPRPACAARAPAASAADSRARAHWHPPVGCPPPLLAVRAPVRLWWRCGCALECSALGPSGPPPWGCPCEQIYVPFSRLSICASVTRH